MNKDDFIFRTLLWILAAQTIAPHCGIAKGYGLKHRGMETLLGPGSLPRTVLKQKPAWMQLGLAFHRHSTAQAILKPIGIHWAIGGCSMFKVANAVQSF